MKLRGLLLLLVVVGSLLTVVTAPPPPPPPAARDLSLELTGARRDAEDDGNSPKREIEPLGFDPSRLGGPLAAVH